MLPSLSPLRMARAKPTTAPRPPRASKSSPPEGENPEHIFLEIVFPRDGQPRAGCGHGVRYENQLGRTAYQRKREKKPTLGAKHPCRARPLPSISAASAEHRLVLHSFEGSSASASSPQPTLTSHFNQCPCGPADSVRVSRHLPPSKSALLPQTGAAILAESSRVSTGLRPVCTEPAPPPGEWCCMTTCCSSSFPFFPHFYLAPPDQPRLPACRSRARRLTRFFQSPRLVLGPAAQDSASSCLGRLARQLQLLPQRRGEQ